jgi:hypothetical protein
MSRIAFLIWLAMAFMLAGDGNLTHVFNVWRTAIP